jgi:hypothetical protein
VLNATCGTGEKFYSNSGHGADKLLSLAMPKRIETDAEIGHFIEVMEPLSRAIEHDTAGPEEIALHFLLATFIKEYDDRA